MKRRTHLLDQMFRLEPLFVRARLRLLVLDILFAENVFKGSATCYTDFGKSDGHK